MIPRRSDKTRALSSGIFKTVEGNWHGWLSYGLINSVDSVSTISIAVFETDETKLHVETTDWQFSRSGKTNCDWLFTWKAEERYRPEWKWQRDELKAKRGRFSRGWRKGTIGLNGVLSLRSAGADSGYFSLILQFFSLLNLALTLDSRNLFQRPYYFFLPFISVPFVSCTECYRDPVSLNIVCFRRVPYGRI